MNRQPVVVQDMPDVRDELAEDLGLVEAGIAERPECFLHRGSLPSRRRVRAALNPATGGHHLSGGEPGSGRPAGPPVQRAPTRGRARVAGIGPLGAAVPSLSDWRASGHGNPQSHRNQVLTQRQALSHWTSCTPTATPSISATGTATPNRGGSGCSGRSSPAPSRPAALDRTRARPHIEGKDKRRCPTGRRRFGVKRRSP